MPRRVDLTGQVIGRLTVVERAKPGSDGRSCWLCICSCGVRVVVRQVYLRNQDTRSCGCLRRERAREWMTTSTSLREGQRDYLATPEAMALAVELGESNYRHGHTVVDGIPHNITRTYRSWVQMRSRCSNPNATGYQYYGGRGISVCERWDSFESFLEDMGERPEGKSMGRIDGDGDYEPDNCEWQTAQEQSDERWARFRNE